MSGMDDLLFRSCGHAVRMEENMLRIQGEMM